MEGRGSSSLRQGSASGIGARSSGSVTAGLAGFGLGPQRRRPACARGPGPLEEEVLVGRRLAVPPREAPSPRSDPVRNWPRERKLGRWPSRREIIPLTEPELTFAQTKSAKGLAMELALTLAPPLGVTDPAHASVV